MYVVDFGECLRDRLRSVSDGGFDRVEELDHRRDRPKKTEDTGRNG